MRNPRFYMGAAALAALFGGGALLGGVPAAQVQSASLAQEPLPAGPLLVAPPAFSAWQIDYVYAVDHRPALAPDVPRSFVLGKARKITLVFMRPAWHATYESVDGSIADEWSNGKTQYYRGAGQPDYDEVPFHDAGDAPVMPDFGKDPFPDWKWIGADNYQGIEQLPGHRCWVFQSGDGTAWVDVESRTPVRWRRREETRTYTRLSDPSGPLQFPPQVAALIDKRKKFENRLNSMVNRPG